MVQIGAVVARRMAVILGTIIANITLKFAGHRPSQAARVLIATTITLAYTSVTANVTA